MKGIVFDIGSGLVVAFLILLLESLFRAHVRRKFDKHLLWNCRGLYEVNYPYDLFYAILRAILWLRHRITGKFPLAEVTPSCHFVFWNDGIKTVEFEDIKRDIALTFSEGRITDAEIRCIVEQTNGISVEISKDKRSVKVSFDYLDFKEGAVIKVIRDTSKVGDIFLSGKIKSGKIERCVRLTLRSSFFSIL